MNDGYTCTHPQLEGKGGGCDFCGQFVLVRRSPEVLASMGLVAPVAAEANNNGDNAERLPDDAYAAQGGKAAVNELLAMKMQQVVRFNNKFDEIRQWVVRTGGREELGCKSGNPRTQAAYNNGIRDGIRKAVIEIETIMNSLPES
jgi:hypothetical protein